MSHHKPEIIHTQTSWNTPQTEVFFILKSSKNKWTKYEWNETFHKLDLDNKGLQGTKQSCH